MRQILCDVCMRKVDRQGRYDMTVQGGHDPDDFINVELDLCYDCAVKLVDRIRLKGMTDLRPCPVCGKEPIVDRNENGDRVAIHCEYCGYRTSFWVDPEDAVRQWNEGGK